LLTLSRAELDAIRDAMLHPMSHSFHPPGRVALYLFSDGSWVIENFRDDAVRVELDGTTQTVPPREWLLQWKPQASLSSE
jgi:hypothetical protein